MASTNQVNVINNSSPNQWRRYSVYQDSGVEWLGEIPGHWEVKKVKYLCQVKRGASPRPIDDPIYFDGEGEYSWVRISDVTASSKYLNTTEQKLSELGRSKSVSLEPGELFLSIAATVGKPIITSIKCCIHDGFVYFPNLKQNREYLFYIFSGGELYKGLGKTGTQLNLNTYTVGEIKIPIPPLHEQKAIASFLDKETARIDDLVEKKERLLKLLKEKRTALISHAVTKGLDPSVAMKDSGIEWLGEIPGHWEVKNAKYLSTIFVPQRNKPKLNKDAGLPWITMEDITHPSVKESTRGYYVNERDALEAGSKPLPAGCVIASCIGNFGVASVNTLPVVINQQLQAYIPKDDKINPWFFRYLVTVSEFYFEKVATATTLVYVNSESFGEMPVSVPPLPEQKAIASYLDQETLKLDNLIKKIRQSIATQKEYRTALISAAVTGKIDVR